MTSCTPLLAIESPLPRPRREPSVESAEAAEYRRALRDYRALMLHRVMNPLTVIRGCAQTMRERPELDGEQREQLLDSIVQMSEHLETISADPSSHDAVEAVLRAVPDLEVEQHHGA